MLVVTRKPDERIVIADSIVVTVIQVERGKVRLGIEAPPQVHILRHEIQGQAVPLASCSAVPGAPPEGG
jgi:carbon storage regulator